MDRDRAIDRSGSIDRRIADRSTDHSLLLQIAINNLWHLQMLQPIRLQGVGVKISRISKKNMKICNLEMLKSFTPSRFETFREFEHHPILKSRKKNLIFTCEDSKISIIDIAKSLQKVCDIKFWAKSLKFWKYRVRRPQNRTSECLTWAQLHGLFTAMDEHVLGACRSLILTHGFGFLLSMAFLCGLLLPHLFICKDAG